MISRSDFLEAPRESFFWSLLFSSASIPYYLYFPFSSFQLFIFGYIYILLLFVPHALLSTCFFHSVFLVSTSSFYIYRFFSLLNIFYHERNIATRSIYLKFHPFHSSPSSCSSTSFFFLIITPSLFFTLPTNFSTTCPSAPSPHFYLPASFHFLLLRVSFNLLLLICPRSSLFLRSCIVAPPRLSSSTLPWPTPLRFFSSFSHFNHPPSSKPSFSASLPCPLPLFARSYVCVCHYTVVIHASTYTEGKQSTRIRIHVGRLAIAFGYNMYSVYPTVDSWYLILESFCVREEWLIVG